MGFSWGDGERSEVEERRVDEGGWGKDGGSGDGFKESVHY